MLESECSAPALISLGWFMGWPTMKHGALALCGRDCSSGHGQIEVHEDGSPSADGQGTPLYLGLDC